MTMNRVVINVDTNNEKTGPIQIDYQNSDGDGTVRLHSALAGGSVSGHFLYKYPLGIINAEHTGMINDVETTGTFDYIRDVIINDIKEIGFFGFYGGYPDPQ